MSIRPMCLGGICVLRWTIWIDGRLDFAAVDRSVGGGAYRLKPEIAA